MMALCEVNAVGCLSRLASLSIADNPLCQSPLLRPYVVFRVAGLQEFNNGPVTAAERVSASDHFSPVAKLLATQLTLATQAGDPRLGRAVAYFGMGNLLGLPRPAAAVGPTDRPTRKEQLQHQKVARELSASILAEATAASQTIQGLHDAWPTLMHQLVRDTVEEIESEANLFGLLD